MTIEVFDDLDDLPDFERSVVTIGSFDGVHAGHQHIIDRLRKRAKEYGGKSIVLTFHPHPRLVLQPDDDSLRLLTTREEKIALLDRYGVDVVVFVPFTKSFSEQAHEAYVRDFLVDKFSPAGIVIGYDHRFGKGRTGNIDYLRTVGEELCFVVEEIPKQQVEDIAVSSTKVRHALDNGQVALAASLLRHPYLLTGKVAHGEQIGKSIGFPTANLDVTNRYKLIPADGIYAVTATVDDFEYDGMLYIGNRPVVEGLDERRIEVNLFNFDKDIYDKEVQVQFVKRLRDDMQLDGLPSLKAQLIKDKAHAMAALDTARKVEAQAAATTPMPEVAVVILNWNGKALLDQYLPTVLQTDYPNLRIIVADNGSTDDSVAALARYPRVEVLQLDRNYGFAGGYNRAIAQITTDYLVLLNSDVAVTDGWLYPLVEAMQKHPEIGACQPKILADARRDHFEYAGAAGGWIDTLGYPFCRGRIFDTVEQDVGQYDDRQEIFWATGAAMCVRPQLFTQLGGFDADFFAHMEEIDLCWRLRRAGYKVTVEPASVVYHLGGGSLPMQSPRKTYLNFRNSLLMLLKNERRSKLAWLIFVRLVLDGVAGAAFIAQGKGRHTLAILKAHFAYYWAYRKTLKKRRRLHKLLQPLSAGRPVRRSGRYRGSILWAYFGRGKKTFREL